MQLFNWFWFRFVPFHTLQNYWLLTQLLTTKVTHFSLYHIRWDHSISLNRRWFLPYIVVYLYNKKRHQTSTVAEISSLLAVPRISVWKPVSPKQNNSWARKCKYKFDQFCKDFDYRSKWSWYLIFMCSVALYIYTNWTLQWLYNGYYITFSHSFYVMWLLSTDHWTDSIGPLNFFKLAW